MEEETKEQMVARLKNIIKEMKERGIPTKFREFEYLEDFIGKDVWATLSDEQKETIGINERVRQMRQALSIDKMQQGLLKELNKAQDVIRYYADESKFGENSKMAKDYLTDMGME